VAEETFILILKSDVVIQLLHQNVSQLLPFFDGLVSSNNYVLFNDRSSDDNTGKNRAELCAFASR
jgi:hypothetical protein